VAWRLFSRALQVAWRLPLGLAKRNFAMSQKTVQLLIGQLLTDEDLRLRFAKQPLETLTKLRDLGFELTQTEIEALVQTDQTLWQTTADRIHPRLQRCTLRLGKS
jgi:hypothetical protein